MKGQCAARYYGTGVRCQFAATHTHRIGPLKVHVCGIHLRTLIRRERLGTEASLLDRWNT